MNRIFSWILFALLLFNLNGVPVAFRLQQKLIRREIKHAIKRRLKEDELIPFLFSREELAELNWIRDHEFRIEQAMYDVVRQEKGPGDSIQLWCINDVQEATLFKNLDDWTRNYLFGEKGLMQLWQHFLQFWSGLWHQNLPILRPLHFTFQRSVPRFAFSYREPTYTLLSPPPELL